MIWLNVDVDTEFDSMRYRQYPHLYEKPIKDNPGLIHGTQILCDLFDEYNIKATFFVQEQFNDAWSIMTQYPELIDMIQNYGHEIGLHVHSMAADHDSRKKDLEKSFFRLKSNGISINSFKAGWYFTNNNTIRILNNLKIDNDCSPVKNSQIGPMKWYDIPDSPYHPDDCDITKIGNSRVLMIPITNYRLGIQWHEDLTIPESIMMSGVQSYFEKQECVQSPLLLRLTIHSWKPIDKNKREINNDVVNRLRRSLDYVLNYDDVKVLSLNQVGSEWRNQNYKPYHLELSDNVKTMYPIHSPYRYFNLVKKLSLIKTIQYRIFNTL